jgi:hypothetical protein
VWYLLFQQDARNQKLFWATKKFDVFVVVTKTGWCRVLIGCRIDDVILEMKSSMDHAPTWDCMTRMIKCCSTLDVLQLLCDNAPKNIPTEAHLWCRACQACRERGDVARIYQPPNAHVRNSRNLLSNAMATGALKKTHTQISLFIDWSITDFKSTESTRLGRAPKGAYRSFFSKAEFNWYPRVDRTRSEVVCGWLGGTLT